MDRPSDQLEEEDEEGPTDPQQQQRGVKPDKQQRRRAAATEPRVIDPYAAEDPSSMMLPVIVAIGAFIPLVFCLCRL